MPSRSNVTMQSLDLDALQTGQNALRNQIFDTFERPLRFGDQPTHNDLGTRASRVRMVGAVGSYEVRWSCRELMNK